MALPDPVAGWFLKDCCAGEQTPHTAAPSWLSPPEALAVCFAGHILLIPEARAGGGRGHAGHHVAESILWKGCKVAEASGSQERYSSEPEPTLRSKEQWLGSQMPVTMLGPGVEVCSFIFQAISLASSAVLNPKGLEEMLSQ